MTKHACPTSEAAITFRSAAGCPEQLAPQQQFSICHRVCLYTASWLHSVDRHLSGAVKEHAKTEGEESSPPKEEDRGDWGQEVPGIGLRPKQPVHLYWAGDGHSQVLVIVSHLLREHHLKEPCICPANT